MMWQTVLTGVFVFIISQFILKLILEPIVALKGVFGEVSALLLRERPRITNGRECAELQSDIRKLSSSLLAKSSAIPFYGKFAPYLGLPSKRDILEVSRSLNLISYCVSPGNKDQTTPITAMQIQEQLSVIGSKLNVPVSYCGL